MERWKSPFPTLDPPFAAMPELPEVETIVRTLAPQVQGRRISAVTVLHPKVVQSGEALLPLLRGATITGIRRRAKLLVLTVRPEAGSAAGQDLLLAFHLKMTGSFFVHPADALPLKHTRLIFDLEGDGRLFFDDTRTFGYCRLMQPGELERWPFWASLGPEPLDCPPETLAAHFTGAFAKRRISIKAALLDQRLVAGIGNIYADESLFRAGIRPDAPASSVTQGKLLVLAKAVQAILRQSIEECGSSIRDYRDALGNAGAFQNAFAVYGRKGETCAVCGAALQACRIAGRGTVYCPRCQQ